MNKFIVLSNSESGNTLVINVKDIFLIEQEVSRTRIHLTRSNSTMSVVVYVIETAGQILSAIDEI